jgi:hypothetical protein
MFASTGLLVLNLGLLAQALVLLPESSGDVPLHEVNEDVAEKIRQLTKASTSADTTCPGKNYYLTSKSKD